MDGVNSVIPLIPVVALIMFAKCAFGYSKGLLWTRQLVLFCFISYCLVLVEIVFLPIPISTKSIENYRLIWGDGFSLNPVPFRTIEAVIFGNTDFINKFRQLGGNIILFIPMPVFIKLISFRCNYKKCIFISMGISLSIETIQFVLSVMYRYPYRDSNIDDLILNTIGAIIGGLSIKLTNNAIKHKE